MTYAAWHPELGASRDDWARQQCIAFYVSKCMLLPYAGHSIDIHAAYVS